MTTSDDHHEIEDHDLGLSHDLPIIVERDRQSKEGRSWGRRGLLGFMGGVGAVALVGCADDDSGTTTTGATDASVEVAEGEIPEETAGPYPGDGSNGANVLSESGVVRSDITSSFGSATGVAEGVPVTVKMKVYDLTGTAVSAMPGAAVYLWHCDRDGLYSLYSEGVTQENYLRGVQEADAEGNVEFTTIFPACYDGRWPHMHFEVYESPDAATSYTNKLRTSQLAIPADVCETVYATAGYESSVDTFSRVSLDTDGIFSDGYSLQLATVTGSVDEGYTFSLNVPV